LSDKNIAEDEEFKKNRPYISTQESEEKLPPSRNLPNLSPELKAIKGVSYDSQAWNVKKIL
jgi:hypothetical protein